VGDVKRRDYRQTSWGAFAAVSGMTQGPWIISDLGSVPLG